MAQKPISRWGSPDAYEVARNTDKEGDQNNTFDVENEKERFIKRRKEERLKEKESFYKILKTKWDEIISLDSTKSIQNARHKIIAHYEKCPDDGLKHFRAFTESTLPAYIPSTKSEYPAIPPLPYSLRYKYAYL